MAIEATADGITTASRATCEDGVTVRHRTEDGAEAELHGRFLLDATGMTALTGTREQALGDAPRLNVVHFAREHYDARFEQRLLDHVRRVAAVSRVLVFVFVVEAEAVDQDGEQRFVRDAVHADLADRSVLEVQHDEVRVLHQNRVAALLPSDGRKRAFEARHLVDVIRSTRAWRIDHLDAQLVVARVDDVVGQKPLLRHAFGLGHVHGLCCLHAAAQNPAPRESE